MVVPGRVAGPAHARVQAPCSILVAVASILAVFLLASASIDTSAPAATMSAQAAWMSGHMEMVSQSDKLLPPLQQSTILVNDDDDHSDKEANGSARPGKRRRNRAVLSCSNCKSRSVTCASRSRSKLS